MAVAEGDSDLHSVVPSACLPALLVCLPASQPVDQIASLTYYLVLST